MLIYGEEKRILDFGNMIYIDTLTDGVHIRTFSKDINPIELKWHMDSETRIIKAVHETDWKIQLENKLPISINDPVIIRHGAWHRLIMGTGNLKLQIVKIHNES